MHPSAERFAQRARDEYDLDIEVTEFPAGTKTADDAADAVGCEVAQIVKSIVMRVGDDLVVALTSGENRVSEQRLADHFDVDPSDVEPASPAVVKDALGWSIGGVPPVCHDEEIPVLFDETLSAYETVWAAAGTPDAVFPIDPDVLLDVSGASVVDVTE
ncbi:MULTISPECIES: YbaK/EbsC family protein [Halostella]|uniref:YbaK/EbsC family protein n=1 Tax=Halostella TaxID=1843185 RepID=UPI001080FA09|nr:MULTISPECIES: YbaK/EbsC family protein [Halostella]